MMLVAVNTFLILTTIGCLVWAIALQSKLHKLELRILEVVSDLDISIARIEHSQTACNNTIADLHGMVTTVSRAVAEPRKELEAIVAHRTNEE
jgi:hypothetical protein